MDTNIVARSTKPKIRLTISDTGQCSGCGVKDIHGACHKVNSQVRCFTGDLYYHVQLMGEVPSTR